MPAVRRSLSFLGPPDIKGVASSPNNLEDVCVLRLLKGTYGVQNGPERIASAKSGRNGGEKSGK